MDEKTIEKLRTQMHQTYERAFVDRVKQAVNNQEHDYIVSLIKEIRERLKGLVPRRSDMHANLDTHIDIVLIEQMLKNNAFGASDFYQIIDAYLQYIKDLQAPVDQLELDKVQAKLNNLDDSLSWADAVAPFFLEVNKLINRIEERRRDALKNPTVLAMLQRAAELNVKFSK